MAFFPQTDAGQFTINLKAPTGTRIEVTEQYVAKVEDLIQRTVAPADFHMVVSNIGIVPDFSALYTTNAGPYTATIQVELNERHKTSSFEYMDRVRRGIARQLSRSADLLFAAVPWWTPCSIPACRRRSTSRSAASDLNRTYGVAQELAARIRGLPGVGEVYIPQDMNYPAIRLNVDRVHAAELGLSPKEVVDNVITALNSNTMIAPNYWVDHKTGNDYFLTVQYYENGTAGDSQLVDLTKIPLRAPDLPKPTTLDAVVKLENTRDAHRESITTRSSASSMST